MFTHDAVLAIGAFLFALGNLLGTVIGPTVAFGSAVQALVDCAVGKIRFRPLKKTGDAARDARRRQLRLRILVIWLVQVVLAAPSIYFIIELYYRHPIPKDKPPDFLQSCLLIVLTCLTVLAFVIGLARLRTTFRSDQLKD